MERKPPARLFHGTPHEIHTSERPFLDPSLAQGCDEGDPEVGHSFATPDLLVASIFAFRNDGCRTILGTSEGPVVVFDSSPPMSDEEGLVYEVPPAGFKETMRRGMPSGKWAIVESDMPLVRDAGGNEVPGISLNDPVRRVVIRDLVEQDGLRVYFLTDMVDRGTYQAAVRDAIHLGVQGTFIYEAVERGWLCDITDQYQGKKSQNRIRYHNQEK